MSAGRQGHNAAAAATGSFTMRLQKLLPVDRSTRERVIGWCPPMTQRAIGGAFVAAVIVCSALWPTSSLASTAVVPKPRVVSGANPFPPDSCGAQAPVEYEGFELMPFLAASSQTPKNFVVS